MDEIASVRAGAVFTSRAPADLADARQNIGNRLLFAVMVDARASSGPDLEQPAPHLRWDAELRRDCGEAHGARGLRRFWIEGGWTDNANAGIFSNHVHDLIGRKQGDRRERRGERASIDSRSNALGATLLQFMIGSPFCTQPPLVV
jgi:hypothetical protein